MSASFQGGNARVCVSAATPERLTPVVRPRVLIGVTSDQTCVVLRGRLRALREAGFDVTVVASPGRWLSLVAEMEGVSAVPIAMRREFALCADLAAFFRLGTLLWRLRPAITDFSTPKCGLLGNLAAWLLRVPRRVYTLRGLRLESSRGMQKFVLLWAERLSAWCASTVLCNSESLRRMALEFRVAPPHKLVVLGHGSTNGVDTERFSPRQDDTRARLGLPADAPVIGFVGRLTRHKGIPELTTAFARISQEEPASWLLLVGWFDCSEDAIDERLRTQIENHPRVRLTGAVEDTAPFYRAMDVFVLPTHREGFPNVALEAAACGVPVITTEATGARDAVVHGVTGLLIPSRRPAAIADSVLSLIRNAEERMLMGAAGRAWMLERYSQSRVLSLVVKFYWSLLEPDAAATKNGARDRPTSANPTDVAGEIGEFG